MPRPKELADGDVPSPAATRPCKSPPLAPFAAHLQEDSTLAAGVDSGGGTKHLHDRGARQGEGQQSVDAHIDYCYVTPRLALRCDAVRYRTGAQVQYKGGLYRSAMNTVKY